ncbi:acetyl-CoA C-acetyltransferase [Catellatospora citrea]|uniref:Acetyl-CoA acetyltransferase n=1 Tax=Catellatospora citrea TaxID=53366 RepID=A0A8J3KX75_9ACTN|nr:acetyl-CoA C-acetyltransferase [Catellatospora citrea]RKE09038.1 acetyl-CoA C-acetyltransferase [Catellatospora citrea]GIG02865.1 acetyl-CoA acetyltransferase [Catellatospora citrea]
MTAEVRKVAVIGGNRIPFARSNSRYARASNQDMLTAALDGLIARHGLAGQRLGEVAAGAVLKHSRDFNLTREAVLGTGLDPATPAVDLQQACGTGLQAITYLANKIALGQLDSGIGGGVDTTSDAPLALNEQFRRILLRLNNAKTTGERIKAAMALRPLQPFKPELPRNAEPRTGLSMGEHAAITAERWGVTRADQDELALDSHRKLAAAYDAGFFDDLLTPYLGLTRDQNLRPDTSLEKLGALKPVYGLRGKNPTMTAGNSTPLTDGAAVVLLGTDEWAAERKLPVLAHFVTAQTAAVDFVHGDPEPEGLLMAPVYAVPQLLSRLDLKLQDFDFYEIHEAFASQVLATLAAWESNGLGTIDRARLNVNGSSLAAGHPFAATGGRIVATAAKLLAQKGRGRALISICAAGGQGVVAVLER